MKRGLGVVEVSSRIPCGCRASDDEGGWPADPLSDEDDALRVVSWEVMFA